MKQFCSRITSDHWIAKNQLHKAVYDIANNMDRMLIDENQLTAFKKTLTDRINQTNNTFKRCKPFEVDCWKINEYRPNETIFVSGVFHMEIYEVRKFNEDGNTE